MLTPAEVARFLSHELKDVRDHALRSLALAGDRSEIKADLPLATLGQIGLNAFSDPELIVQLPPSPEVAAKAFAAAANASLPARAISASLLQELPTALLLAHRNLVQTLPAGNLRTRLEHRLALAQQPHDKLWQQLVACTDPAETHALILALIPQDSAIAPLVSSVLLRNVPAPGEPAAIELAGRTHLATVVNPLVDRLARPEPGIADAASTALGRLGTAGAATILEQRCNMASATPAFRFHAARAMARFRIPSVEATLLRLLAEEDDPAALCALCMALADICTTTGFARLSEVVASGRCGQQTAGLKQIVAALDVMVKGAAARSTATHYAPSAPPATPTSPLPVTPTSGPLITTLGSSEFSGLEMADPDLAPSDELPLMEIPDELPPAEPVQAAPGTTQLRRDTNQVGRNDLCPCGSGKKYKKCCGA